MSTRTVTQSQREHREAFGRRLRQLRGDRSQQWLADQMEVDRRTVMRLEAGKVPAELHLVAAAADALECGVATLIASVLPKEQLEAEVDSLLLRDAAYQRARSTAHVLDQRMRALRKGLDEMAAQQAEFDRLGAELDEVAARFKA